MNGVYEHHHLTGRRVVLRAGVALCALMAGLAVGGGVAHAGPSGGDVVAGSAVIGTAGDTTTITQSTDRAAINWQSFDVGGHETVRFVQPSSTSFTLNRVVSGNPTTILGRIEANGGVALINPNGVMFGQGAVVDVSGLIASSADMDTQGFMSGGAILSLDSAGNKDASIINEGSITVGDAGLAAFVAPSVVNNGTITARLGRVVLAGGDTATLDLYGDGLISVAVTDEPTAKLVSNSGIISADGGQVMLTAAAGQEIVNNLVNTDGIITANAVEEQTGRIVLYAQGSNAVTNNTALDKGIKEGLSITSVSGIVQASSTGSDAAGTIEVLGDHVYVLGAWIDASSPQSGGTIRIGGDYLGQNITPTSVYTGISDDSSISADAFNQGDGGNITIWSDGTTDYYGHIYARGGENLGNGGFVEVSGKQYLNFLGEADLTAPNGNKGTLLLDPENIIIYGNFAPNYVSTDGTINLATSLQLWLDGNDIDGDGVSEGVNEDGVVSGIANCGSDIDCVATWSDKSGNGNDVLQLTNNSRPKFLENSLNGLDTLIFDGINDYLDGGDILDLRNYSHNSFVSGNYDTPAKIYDTIYSKSRFAAAIGRYAFLKDKNYLTGTGAMVNLSGSYQDIASVSDTIEQRIMRFALNRNQKSEYAENSIIKKSIALGIDDIDYDTLYNFYVGVYANSTGTSPYFAYAHDGTINEILIYNAALAQDTNNLLEQYQSAKWGIDLTPPGTGASEAEQAMAADGYSAFTVGYLEKLSQTADIELLATSNITLDLKGDALNLASDRNITMTATGGNIVDLSPGTIQTTRTGAGGNITLDAGGDIDLDTTNLEALNGGVVNLLASGNVSLSQDSALNLGSVVGNSVLLRSTDVSSDITLNNTITATDLGDAITLVSGQHFINTVGSGALNTPSGRWLVYSDNAASNIENSLVYDFWRAGCIYGGACGPSLPVSGNGLIYRTKPTLTVTAQSYTKDYYAPDPVWGYNASGFIKDDTANILTGALLRASGERTGDYAITQGTLDTGRNYSITFIPGTLTIKAQPLIPSTAQVQTVAPVAAQTISQKNGRTMTSPSPLSKSAPSKPASDAPANTQYGAPRPIDIISGDWSFENDIIFFDPVSGYTAIKKSIE